MMMTLLASRKRKIFSPLPSSVSVMMVSLLLVVILPRHCLAFPDLKNNPYVPASSVEERSPCPALNALANYGFIPRDGKNVSIAQSYQELEQSFGLNDGGAIFAGAKLLGLPVTTDGKGVEYYNLFDLFLVQFDASLVRRDHYFEPIAQPDASLLQELVDAAGEDGLLSRNEYLAFRDDRFAHSRLFNPTAYLPLDPNNIVFRGILANAVAILFLGADPDFETVPVENLLAFLGGSARFPVNFTTRLELGQSITYTNTDPAVLAWLGTAGPRQFAAFAMGTPAASCALSLNISSHTITETSTMTLAQAGSFTGPEDIKEYVRFSDQDNPYFATQSTVNSTLDFIGYSSEDDACVFRYMRLDYSELDPNTATADTVNYGVMTKIYYKPMENKVIAVHVYYARAFLKWFFAVALATDATRGYICDVMALESCRSIYELNKIPSREACIDRLAMLPFVEGEGQYFDGLSQGCRALHATLAATNKKHCPHLSFEPVADVNGAIKCQTSANISVASMFTSDDIQALEEWCKEQIGTTDCIEVLTTPSSTMMAPTVTPKSQGIPSWDSIWWLITMVVFFPLSTAYLM